MVSDTKVLAIKTIAAVKNEYNCPATKKIRIGKNSVNI